MVGEVADIAFPALGLPNWTMTLVVTVSILGFPIAVALAWAFDLTPQGLTRGLAGEDTAVPASAMAGLMAKLGEAEAEPDPLPSVAVLPFVNVDHDEETEDFSDGITGEILSALAKVEGLRVAARSSSFAFRGEDRDVREIARALGVGAVLEGSARKVGNRIRITAELLSAADGRHLFSGTYSRETGDVQALHDEVTRAIVHAVRVRLGLAESNGRGRTTPDLEAHNCFLKAHHFWSQRTPRSLQKAASLLDQALERDPEYALAHATRSSTLALLGESRVLPPTSAFAEARAAAERALELDGDLPEAHAALGFVKTLAWDWAEVDQHFRRAIDLAPDYPTARHWFSIYLTAVGRLEDARAQIEEAQELDPLSAIVHAAAAGLQYYSRNPESALEGSQRALELDPSSVFAHTLIALAYEQRGDYTAAIAALGDVDHGTGSHPFPRTAQGHVWASYGERAAAERALDGLRQSAHRREGLDFYLAALHAALGDPDAAFHRLERAIEYHDGWILSLSVHPWMDTLRQDPRYPPLVGGIGLGEHQGTARAAH